MSELEGVEDALVCAIGIAVARLRGAVVTSWHRSPSENALSGGADRSRHLRGGAFDLRRTAADEILEVLRRMGFVVEWHEKGTAPHWHVYPGDGARKLIRTLGLMFGGGLVA